MFAYALGLAPSKDTFWTTDVQPGNRYSKIYAKFNNFNNVNKKCMHLLKKLNCDNVKWTSKI